MSGTTGRNRNKNARKSTVIDNRNTKTPANNDRCGTTASMEKEVILTRANHDF
jgi:hypothetical protein